MMDHRNVTNTHARAIALFAAAWCYATFSNAAGEEKLAASASPAEPHIALVIGLSAYDQFGGFGDLDYAHRDADAVADSFRAIGYTVVKMTSFRDDKGRVTATIGGTRAALVSHLRKLKDYFPTPNTGTIVFSYAGHGASVAGENYLVPFEGDREDLASSALDLKTVIRELEATGARRRIMLLDACRNSPAKRARGGGKFDSFVRFQEAKGYTILFASEFGTPSYELKGLAGGHGVFSHFVAQGLHGRASRDGVITFDSLSSYVEQSVRDFFVDTPFTQVPFRSGERHGDFLLAKVDSAAPSAAAGVRSDAEQLRNQAQQQLESSENERNSGEMVLGAEDTYIAAMLSATDDHLAAARQSIASGDVALSNQRKPDAALNHYRAAVKTLSLAATQLATIRDTISANRKLADVKQALEANASNEVLSQLIDKPQANKALITLLQRYRVRVNLAPARSHNGQVSTTLSFTGIYEDGIPARLDINRNATISLSKTGESWGKAKLDWQP